MDSERAAERAREKANELLGSLDLTDNERETPAAEAKLGRLLQQPSQPVLDKSHRVQHPSYLPESRSPAISSVSPEISGLTARDAKRDSRIARRSHSEILAQNSSSVFIRGRTPSCGRSQACWRR